MPNTHTALSDALYQNLKAQLPQSMRDQLNQSTQARVYFLLSMLNDDAGIHQLRKALQKQHPTCTPSKPPLEQALELVSQLQQHDCDHKAPFKYRLPHFLGEYPIHSSAINSAIQQFNQLIETYHADEYSEPLNAVKLNRAYQNVLDAIQKHYMGCNPTSLWQLLGALTGWSKSPIEPFLNSYPSLLSSVAKTEKAAQAPTISTVTQPVDPINLSLLDNRKAKKKPFTTTFDYSINEAGRIAEQSIYLSVHGFALKPGGHADAIAKHIPQFLPWSQWQGTIRRQLSQLIELPLNDVFFDWLQLVLQQLGVAFLQLHSSSYESYVSPFLNHKTLLHTLNEEHIMGILQEQCIQANITIDPALFPVISRFLIRFLYRFQFNRGEALGIGANWGGVISDSNEAATDGFRFNDPVWAALFKNLSLHRQGPAEVHMNAAIGVKHELKALLSSFEYMTQLQPSEYNNTLYNALVDNLVTTLFPAPPYFENQEYSKYRRHDVVTHTDDGEQHIQSFYRPDPQGTYFKTKTGEYKQTPMFRQAGSLSVEPFPRDSGSGECVQSLSVANPLWPLQLQYAQSAATGVRGHLVYNPVGPDEFIPDTFYGQVIRETDDVFIPFIGVIPKNFDKHFNQVELCASFVVRMLQSSRLMTYCPAFQAFYDAIATRFLPDLAKNPPALPDFVSLAIDRKWSAFNTALHDPQRSAEACHKAFFSLFKELVYSLYALDKNDMDLHYYFLELTTSEHAFEPQNRATCERLIRELMTLKPIHNAQSIQPYEAVIGYLKELTNFFYPIPNDETAKAIAQQAKLHVTPLLATSQIKEYFAALKESKTENLATTISPGLMHDALKYQAPSPHIYDDFYRKRHGENFQSGFRDIDGNQIAEPSTRESTLDFLTKTVGALLPHIRRNKTLFSLLTQPFAQAYIAGHETYSAEEQYKLAKAIFSGFSGFIFGLGLGAEHALGSIPRAIYNSLVSTTQRQRKAEHALAISSAPGNEPGLRVEAMMDIRDHLLRLMAKTYQQIPSYEQLVQRLLKHVAKIHPSLLAKKITKDSHYKQVLSATFPLSPSEWNLLFTPIIEADYLDPLQQLISQYVLQIDRIFIHALYECLTTPDCAENPEQAIKKIIDKHKLKDPQDQALTSFTYYYLNNPEAKKRDIAQYRFQGTALIRLKEREFCLRKIQTWMNKALDKQWGLEELLSHFMPQYRMYLNPQTLPVIVAELPESIKEVLSELISSSRQPQSVLGNYSLEASLQELLLACLSCYQKISSTEMKQGILNLLRINQSNETSLSIKAREHLKLTQFISREWSHQLFPEHILSALINEIKQQIESSIHEVIDELASHYLSGIESIKNPEAFDAFYNMAMHLQKEYDLSSPLHEWLNVTMNGFLNALLDETKWNNEKPLNNPLRHSPALMDWLHHLMSQKNGIRTLLAQQIEQAPSLDQAAWRCQLILNALETSNQYIHKTGMQKLLRTICQNKDTITATGVHKARDINIAGLCKHSITMQHALQRVQEKVPAEDMVRAINSVLF